MKVTSNAFKQGEAIPEKYTCEGEDISLPLQISEVPKKAQSLILIMEDLDVPVEIKANGVWDHWIVFNINPCVKEISEGENIDGILGKNTWGNLGYGGPCPPDKEHRYFIRIFALDGELELEEGASKSEILNSAQGHVVAKAELMGKYRKKN